jgi:Tfp pilus assembly protein PilF
MAVSLGVFSIQATGTILQAKAESSADPFTAERYYLASLRLNSANPAAQFSYGMWLYGKKRSAESVPYLKSAVAKGFNSSICFPVSGRRGDDSRRQNGC